MVKSFRLYLCGLTLFLFSTPTTWACEEQQPPTNASAYLLSDVASLKTSVDLQRFIYNSERGTAITGKFLIKGNKQEFEGFIETLQRDVGLIVMESRHASDDGVNDVDLGEAIVNFINGAEQVDQILSHEERIESFVSLKPYLPIFLPYPSRLSEKILAGQPTQFVKGLDGANFLELSFFVRDLDAFGKLAKTLQLNFSEHEKLSSKLSVLSVTAKFSKDLLQKILEDDSVEAVLAPDEDYPLIETLPVLTQRALHYVVEQPWLNPDQWVFSLELDSSITIEKHLETVKKAFSQWSLDPESFMITGKRSYKFTLPSYAQGLIVVLATLEGTKSIDLSF